jgi:SAM-dependent methyltransferase
MLDCAYEIPRGRGPDLAVAFRCEQVGTKARSPAAGADRCHGPSTGCGTLMKVPWFRRHFLFRRQLDRIFLDAPDAIFRRMTGRGDWPPYSLRSFVGGAKNFDRVGRVFLDDFRRLGLFNRGTRILDIGCGCGRIARAFAEDGRLQELQVSYTGMDIDRASVEWCQRHITPLNDRFRFYQADCFNPSYNPHGSAAADAYVFPHPDASFDLILATSVMTHLLENDMRHYLAEVSRMLAPGGVAYASFFLFPSLDLAATGAERHGIRFPFRMGNSAVNREDHPTNAVAYGEPYVRSAVQEFGLEIIEPTLYGLQDVLFLTKAPGTWIPAQLVSGWHELEDNCWRWTERAFSVRVHRRQRDNATLRFRFHVPPEHKKVRLRSHVERIPLSCFEYDTPGEQLYISDIPADAWLDDSALIQFQLDQALPPSSQDRRELGVQVMFAECPGSLNRRLEPFTLERQPT